VMDRLVGLCDKSADMSRIQSNQEVENEAEKNDGGEGTFNI